MKRTILIMFILVAALMIFWALESAVPSNAQAMTQEQWCQKWEKIFENRWDRWATADACFHPKQIAWVSPLYPCVPDAGSPPEYYVMAVDELKGLIKTFNHKLAVLKHKMTHPKAYRAGAWKPLIRWTWPDHSEAVVAKVDRIMGRESGWTPTEVTGSFVGLMQEYHGSTDPMTNLKTAHRWYHDDLKAGGDGWRPWAQTAY